MDTRTAQCPPRRMPPVQSAPPALPPVQTVSPAATAPPLTAEHSRLVAEAEARGRKIRRASMVALLSGLALAGFSGLSLLWAAGALALDGFDLARLDGLTLAMGLGLGALAWNEFRGRTLLRRFDLRGPRVLGINQLALLGVVVAYSGWMIAAALWGPNPYEEVMAREPLAAEVLGNIGDMHKRITVIAYSSVIAGTLIFQGLTAAYYFSRGAVLRSYLRQTPAWLVDLQRATGG